MCSWFLELLNGTSIRRKIQTATIWERVKKLLNSRRNLLPTTIIWIPIGRKRKISWTWQQCHQLKSQSIIIDFTFILLKIILYFNHISYTHIDPNSHNSNSTLQFTVVHSKPRKILQLFLHFHRFRSPKVHLHLVFWKFSHPLARKRGLEYSFFSVQWKFLHEKVRLLPGWVWCPGFSCQWWFPACFRTSKLILWWRGAWFWCWRC